MAIQLPPIPNNPITDVFVWRDWFYKVSQVLSQQAAIAWTSINFTGSNLRDIQTRQHNALQAIDGGVGGQYYHLTQAQWNQVTNYFNYGSFSNDADQILAGANTPTKVAFNTTDVASGITRSSNEFTITKAGKYQIIYSLQAVNTDSQAHALYVWLRKNNNDVAGSASKFDVPSSHGSSDGYLIAVSTVILDLAVNDVVALYAASSNIYDPVAPSAGVYFEAYTSSTSPYNRPSIPSNIINITQVA